jgi:hypothetical protein
MLLRKKRLFQGRLVTNKQHLNALIIPYYCLLLQKIIIFRLQKLPKMLFMPPVKSNVGYCVKGIMEDIHICGTIFLIF